MGIAPYKYFTYDGESSRNYDVYLTGEGVFNAPERAVEMLEIPGRNGNYALDQGKFNNITVTYKAGIVDVSESNFANKVSAVRNWLCSKVGYKRLSDDYNPNEYRMAVYKSGVNIDHVDLKTGEFEITFDCKPQRWLTSGETAVSVADSGTLDNPTPFESEPLLAVKGYGDISFNGYTITIENEVLGDVVIADSVSFTSSKTFSVQQGTYNSGDSITVDIGNISLGHCSITAINGGAAWDTITSITSSDSLSGFTTTTTIQGNGRRISGDVYTEVEPITFTEGTTYSKSSISTVTIVYVLSGTTYTAQFKQIQKVEYNASAETITVSSTVTRVNPDNTKFKISNDSARLTGVDITLDSTVAGYGNPSYIDCDIGECYKIENDEIITLNDIITLGSDLPKLVSGTNTFTYDNTVTELKVTPRYWKV